jgi:5-hydroxyisourate hydrolase
MADGFLTTHVLDTAAGTPAAGMQVTLYRLSGDARETLVSMTTNEDGRTNSPILPKETFATGSYELVFQVGAYLDEQQGQTKANRFLDVVPIRFQIDDETSHYHVPLLVSPFGFSTYRGS